VSLETWHITNENSLAGRGGRKRSGLVSSEMWHIIEGSPTGGEEEGGTHS
jgi:hypothetical protein